MKIVKTMASIAFAFACLFSFAGCDLFGNGGTLIEEPTEQQLTDIVTAISTNTADYEGDYTLVYSGEYNYYSSNTYIVSGVEKEHLTYKQKGTGDNLRASRAEEYSARGSTVTLDYYTAMTGNRYVAKIGDNYCFVRDDSNGQEVRTYFTSIENALEYSSIYMRVPNDDSLDSLSDYTSDELQVYALSDDDTSFRIVLNFTDFNQTGESDSLAKAVISIQVSLITVNDALVISSYSNNTVMYNRTETTGAWVKTVMSQDSFTYTYSCGTIILPSTTGFEIINSSD